MQCVILVGGRGSRLGELTRDRPKPMLPVAGRPFLDHLVANVARFGVEDFLLLAGHQAAEVQAQAEALARVAGRPGVRIRVVVEPEPLGTGGAVRFAAEHLESAFLLMNGDTFFDINLLDLALARSGPQGAVMAVRQVEDASRCGVVEFGADGRIASMLERPSAPGPGLANGGVYWMNRAVVSEIPEGFVSLEGEILPRLAAQGRLTGRLYDGFFLDIGVPEDYAAAQSLLPRSRPAVFFDRDGVLNLDEGYTHRPEQFRWSAGAIEAVKAVNDTGAFAFVITNQAGVARGYYGEPEVQDLHRWMNAELAAMGAHIDDFRYCPHHPDATRPEYAIACSCRKPEPGMLLDLLAAWPVDRARAVVLGDQDSDIEAARRAGLPGAKVCPGDLLGEVRQRLDGWRP
jgi:D-glycero-D-manno-heptose 1,7-bisphosphate phosphatase